MYASLLRTPLGAEVDSEPAPDESRWLESFLGLGGGGGGGLRAIEDDCIDCTGRKGRFMLLVVLDVVERERCGWDTGSVDDLDGVLGSKSSLKSIKSSSSS